MTPPENTYLNPIIEDAAVRVWLIVSALVMTHWWGMVNGVWESAW